MARHNREARGVDQLGTLWSISYQPDWLSRIKISRQLPGDRRRSMVTLFRNPARRAEASPGKVVRTGVSAVDGSVDFRVAVEDPDGVVEGGEAAVEPPIVQLAPHGGLEVVDQVLLALVPDDPDERLGELGV